MANEDEKQPERDSRGEPQTSQENEDLLKEEAADEGVREEIISRARLSRPSQAPSATPSATARVDDYAPPIPKAPEPSPPSAGVGNILESLLGAQIAVGRPRIRDMALFCRQLSTLLDVGIPLLQSLRILAERSSHPRLRSVTKQIATRVEEGNTLSVSLAEHPKVFSDLFVSVVKVGETGGILEASMRRLAQILEMKASMKRKVASAMMYPAAAVMVCILVLTFIMYWAVPRFQMIYAELGDAELPKATQRLIAISDFVRDYPALYIPLILVVAVALYLFGKTKTGRTVYHWLALKTYLIGPINMSVNVARFTRSLGALVAAGIPLLEALRVSADTSENCLIAQTLRNTHDSLEGGGRLENPLRQGSIIPPMVVDMMVIGYEAGALDDMLLKVADTYDEQVDETLKGLASIIEPVLIVMLGMVVAFVGLALLLPYFNLVTVIQ